MCTRSVSVVDLLATNSVGSALRKGMMDDQMYVRNEHTNNMSLTVFEFLNKSYVFFLQCLAVERCSLVSHINLFI